MGGNVTIGHACIIHACTLEDRAFVGMGATVLDGAVIAEGGMLAAGGLLTPGKRIGPNELWAGVPAPQGARHARSRGRGERSHRCALPGPRRPLPHRACQHHLNISS